MKFTKLILIISIIVLLTGVIACTPTVNEVEVTREVEKIVTVEVESEEESTLENARREGVIRVGFSNESPYAYATTSGVLTGESVEVARAIFYNLGIEKMDGVLTEWSSLIPGLKAKRFDAITAGMFILPDRCDQVLFGDPDYSIKDGIITGAGNPFQLHSYEDVAANPDIKIGTGAGYSSYEQMLGAGVKEEQIELFPDGPSGFAGLQAGRIDAWTATSVACRALLDNADDESYEMVDPFDPPVIDGKPVINYGAVAFRYKDSDLREAYNEELAKLKESGELLEITSQFEGFGKHSLPGDITAEDVCPAGVYENVGK